MKVVSYANSQSGFILISVLFFLLIIALLLLSLLNTTHLALRMSQNYAMASQQFWAAEAGLKVAEDRLAERWAEEGFHDTLIYAGYQVQYDIQRFSLPFCSEKRVVYYYRITAKAKQAQRHALVLQTTYARKTNASCQGKVEKHITEGRRSWREFS
jgi:Tfp pilus assembly protein PilX